MIAIRLVMCSMALVKYSLMKIQGMIAGINEVVYYEVLF
jgi:hypothetical protein